MVSSASAICFRSASPYASTTKVPHMRFEDGTARPFARADASPSVRVRGASVLRTVDDMYIADVASLPWPHGLFRCPNTRLFQTSAPEPDEDDDEEYQAIRRGRRPIAFTGPGPALPIPPPRLEGRGATGDRLVAGLWSRGSVG